MTTQFGVTVEELSFVLGTRFTVQREVRRGAQGIVFKALRAATPTGEAAADVVALKVYAPGTQLARIEREIDALTQIRHSSTANLVEHGTLELGAGETIYVACDFIEGTALDERLSASGAVSYRTAAVIGRDIATAIAQLWAHRIVHRDVSPKNIMLRIGEREAVLIDLGIARHVQRRAITSGGRAWGTEGYMSPEQYRAEQQLSALSDVFSLGVVLQEALLGSHPNGGDQEGVMRRTAMTEALDPQAPDNLCAIIDKMLSLRSSFRPRPSELIQSFSRIIAKL